MTNFCTQLRRNAAKRLKSPNYGDWCGSSTLLSLTTPNSSTPNSSLHHRSLSPTVALKKLSSGWSPFVLDVRTINESSIATLPFTDSIVPHRDVRKVDVPVEGDILVYCKGGKRSELAIRSLIENGVEEQRLWNLEGGILKWQEVRLLFLCNSGGRFSRLTKHKSSLFLRNLGSNSIISSSTSSS